MKFTYLKDVPDGKVNKRKKIIGKERKLSFLCEWINAH